MSSEAGPNASQPSLSSSSSATRLSNTPYNTIYHPQNALRIDNQLIQKHRPPELQSDHLKEPSAPPYSQLLTFADQEEPSAPIDDPIQQQILEAEQDPNSAPIDDDDTISLAAPIYDPTAVAAPYLTYAQEPTIDLVDTSRKHKNRIALVAFIVQLAGFLGVTIYATVLWLIKGRESNLMLSTIKVMAPVLLYAILMMAFVNSGGIVIIVIWHADSDYLLGTLMPAIGLIMVLLPMCWFYLRRRIPFTSAVLKSTSSLSRKYRSITILSYAGLAMQLLLALFFSMIVHSDSLNFQELEPSTYNIMFALCLPCYYWTSQVITNIVYATVAGVAAIHYLPSKTLSDTSFKSFLKSVCTTSLGSICYGSLIIAPVQIVRSASNRLRTSEDDVDVCCVSFLDAIIGCVRGFNTSINKYAFYDVAIYGKPFYPAAKDTWSSIESRKIDVLLRDFALGHVLIVHAVSYSVLCGTIAIVASNYSILHLLAIAWMTMQIVFSAGTAADASAASALVALAKDPLVFAKANPEFFAELREAYPAVSFGLMVIIPGVP
ncbi:putative choline transporter, neither null mutation nor overexpression affects choline transport [Podila epicladia]|nr:putative choline transporter, neither null mutation nor overexpression affects choline transport [Podila epicladia]